jgi:hypothetical protein
MIARNLFRQPSLTGRNDNPIPTQFLAPIDCFKIPALDLLSRKYLFLQLNVRQDMS